MDSSQRQIALDFIASLNYLHTTTRSSRYTVQESIHVTDYRGGSEAENRRYEIDIEMIVLDTDPAIVKQMIAQLNLPKDVRYRISLLHTEDEPGEAADVYSSAGYQRVATAPLQVIDLPYNLTREERASDIRIEEAFNEEDVEYANEWLDDTDSPMPMAGIGDPFIRRYYAEIDRAVVGWGQMVNGAASETAFVGDLFTEPAYRGRGVGLMMLDKMHE
ncbi:MAG: GNAT family N-acetyltransferase, partial [Chloroflexota bacterium]